MHSQDMKASLLERNRSLAREAKELKLNPPSTASAARIGAAARDSEPTDGLALLDSPEDQIKRSLAAAKPIAISTRPIKVRISLTKPGLCMTWLTVPRCRAFAPKH